MLLDPTLDVVFKMLLTRRPDLLHDVLESVLGRPIGGVRILDSTIYGEQAADRRVNFDIRVALDDGSPVNMEMQRREMHRSTLRSRMVYYVAREFSDQLRRGDEYHLLRPATGIIWAAKPVLPAVDRLHSVFEMRDRHANVCLTDQLAIHLLQLPCLTPSDSIDYTDRVQLWARFFTARDDATRAQLAVDPIMSTALNALEQLSEDPEARRLARRREDAIKFYEMELAASKAEARTEGRAAGEALGKAEFLVLLLEQRFGPLSTSDRALIDAATTGQLEVWAPRVLTALTLDEVLRP